ncbi:protein of unknown function [Methylacidimicrobium sp. AP8]|nr:protein of unknown function [Methylacidimicrobium sp. AP8]
MLLRWPTESPVQDPVPGLRRLSWWVPILALAESDEPEARREALESGADFLLRFPGAERELLAILESLGSRYARNPPEESPGSRPPILDRKNRIVRWRDQAVSLTPAELTIADYLFQHAGRVVMAEELAAQLYRRHPARLPSPLSLHTHLSNLRRKLSRLSTGILLRSVCGKGFLLEWGPGGEPPE